MEHQNPETLLKQQGDDWDAGGVDVEGDGPIEFYVGFDTEYVASDTNLNTTLDVQFAILDPYTGHVHKNLISLCEGEDVRYKRAPIPKHRSMTFDNFLRVIIDQTHQHIGDLSGKTRHRKIDENGERVWQTHDYSWKINLVGHFTRADITHFADWPKFKNSVDLVRGTYCTTTRPIVRHIKHRKRRKESRVSVTLYDTSLYCRSSLDDIGKQINIPKLTLGPWHKHAIHHAKIWDRQRYEAYALRDAEIAVRYLHELHNKTLQNLGLQGEGKPPPTIASVGARLARQQWERAGKGADHLLGYWDQPTKDGGTKRALIHELKKRIEHIALCYHGGRNEAYGAGVFTAPEGRLFRDIDIVGAYSGVLGFLPEADWRQTYDTDDLKILADPGHKGIALAWVKFEFPRNGKRPCLPVRARRKRGRARKEHEPDLGLVFPRQGKSYCTGPELFAARNMGAKITVLDGTFTPWKDPDNPYRLFNQMMRDGNAIRASERNSGRKGGVLDTTAKDALNSTYGKLAQGYEVLAGWQGRRAFNQRTGEMETIPPSAITQPAYAAYVTGFVRALLAELLDGIPNSALTLNAITDGFLTTAKPSEINTRGPLAVMFEQMRAMQNQHGPIIEEKGVSKHVLSARTRFCVSVGKDVIKPINALGPNQKVRDLHVMKAPPGWSLDAWERHVIERHNRRKALRAWKRRTYGHAHLQRVGISPRDMYFLNADFVIGEVKKTLPLDFDFKVRLSAGSVVDRFAHIQGVGEPWDTVDDFVDYREALQNWRDENQRLLVTKRDLIDFEAWQRKLATTPAPKPKTTKPKKGGQRTKQTKALVPTILAHWDEVMPGSADYQAFIDALAEVGVSLKMPAMKTAISRGRTKQAKPGSTGVRRRKPDQSELQIAIHLHSRFSNFQIRKLF